MAENKQHGGVANMKISIESEKRLSWKYNEEMARENITMQSVIERRNGENTANEIIVIDNGLASKWKRENGVIM